MQNSVNWNSTENRISAVLKEKVYEFLRNITKKIQKSADGKFRQLEFHKKLNFFGIDMV